MLMSLLMSSVSSAYAEEKPLLPLQSVAGQDKLIQFNEYLGHVVLIDFWASWCGPCRQSFPWMNAMQEKYKDQGFDIIAINLDSDTDDAHQFLKEVPAQFTIGFDPTGLTAEKMAVEAMPMSYLISRDGQIQHRFIGFNTQKKLSHEAHIKTLLAEKQVSKAAINDKR